MKKFAGPGIFLAQFVRDRVPPGSLFLLSYDYGKRNLNDEFSQAQEAEQ
jgi:hypothetical protein